MSRKNKNAKKKMRTIAAALAMVLFLSDFVPIPVLAAQEEEIKIDADAKAEEIEDAKDSEPFEEDDAGLAETDMEKAGAGMEETEEAEEMLTEEEIAAQKAMRPAYLPVEEVEELPEHYVAERGYGNLDRLGSSFESAYDFRDSGFLTRIKNQNPWGTCWAFSAIASMETSLTRQGLASPDKIDLSERHLAYFTFHTGFDRLGNADKDTISSSGENYYLINGGSPFDAVMRMMNWQGAADERKYPYSSVLPAPLQAEQAQDNAYHMRDCYLLDTKANDQETIQNVKAMVRQYGCVQWSYFDDTEFMNYHTKAYYKDHYTDQETADKVRTNHSVAVVGWDDNFPKTRFLTQPKEDGAWIIRNSWSESWGENGYFYISYEDVSLGSGNPAAAYIADTDNNYDNNYFYSNSQGCYSTSCYGRAAQVYEVKGLTSRREQLKAVSFFMGGTNTDYKIQIYKNPKLEGGIVKDPESGTPMLETAIEGKTSYAGVYTVDLPVPVFIDAGDLAAVVITFPDKPGTMYYDKSGSSGNEKGTREWHNEVGEGQSFRGTSNGSWKDLYSDGASLRINLLTDDLDEEEMIADLGLKAVVQQPADFNDTYKILLRWDRSDFVTKYEIWRRLAGEENSTYEKIGETAYSRRQYTDEAESGAVGEYRYIIRVLFSDGTCQDSPPAVVKLEDGIKFGSFRAEFDGKIVRLTWNGIDGAAGYEIQRKEEKDTEYTDLSKVTDLSALSYEDDLGGQSGSCWQYRIRAYHESGQYTAWSQAREVAKDLRITQVDCRTLRFSWPPAEGAARYGVYLVIDGMGFGYLYKNNSADIDIENWIQKLKENPEYDKYSIPDFHVGDTYSFYMQPRDSDGKAMEAYRTPKVSVYTIPDDLFLDTPETEGDSSIKLSFRGGDGADTVRIYRSENPDDNGTVCAEVPAAAGVFTDTENIRKGVTYYYRIQPTVKNSREEIIEGNISSYKAVTIPQQQAARFTSAAPVSDTEVSLAWEKVSGADGYLIYRGSKRGGTGTLLTEITGQETTAYKDTGLTPGEIAYYNIRAYVQQGEEKVSGPLSGQKKVRTLPEQVQIKGAALTEASSVRVEWEKAQGADGYIVERRMDAEEFVQAANITSRNLLFWEDTVSEGHICTYRVKAYNMPTSIRPQYGAPSGEETVVMPVGKVQGLKAVYKDNAAELTWEAVLGAKEYNVSVKTGQGEYTGLGAAEECRYIWKDVQPATVYTFRVTAVGQDGNEGREETLCELRVLPEPVKITGKALHEKKIRISWQAVEETSYDLYKRDEKSNYSLLAEGLTEGLYEDEEIVTGKTYSYKVAACKNGLKSDLSQTYRAKVQPVPDQPVVTETGTNQITIHSNPDYEYAIGTVSGNTEGLAFLDTQEDILTFDGLTPDSMYYITARTKETVTEEAPVNGKELAVNTCPDGLWAAGSTAQTYTGKAITLQLQVYVGAERLKKGQDYTVTYKNNKKAKSVSSGGKVPSVILRGRKKYAGLNQTYTFDILPKDIGKGTSYTLTNACTYNGKKAPQTGFSIRYNGMVLKKGRDYTLSWEDSSGHTVARPGGAGDYTLVAKGIGNYTGEQRHVVHILDESRIPMSRVKITKIKSVNWDGTAKTPAVAVKYRSALLTSGTDYEVTYRRNTDAGTAYVYIEGKGMYVGRRIVTFKIKGTSLSKVSVKGFKSSMDFTGQAVLQPSMRLVTKKGGQELAEGTDYTVSYTNHIEAGKASVTITGIGGYTGTIKKTFRIR